MQKQTEELEAKIQKLKESSSLKKTIKRLLGRE